MRTEEISVRCVRCSDVFSIEGNRETSGLIPWSQRGIRITETALLHDTQPVKTISVPAQNAATIEDACTWALEHASSEAERGSIRAQFPKSISGLSQRRARGPWGGKDEEVMEYTIRLSGCGGILKPFGIEVPPIDYTLAHRRAAQNQI